MSVEISQWNLVSQNLITKWVKLDRKTFTSLSFVKIGKFCGQVTMGKEGKTVGVIKIWNEQWDGSIANS